MTGLTSTAPSIWSRSQVSAHNECLRKLFFHRVSYPEAEKLKKLKNRHLWAGSLVHETIGALLKTVRQGREVPSEDAVVFEARQRMQSEFKRSMEGNGDTGRLFEHEYAVPTRPEIWRGHWAVVEKSLKWFLNSRWFERLKSLGPECWKTVDEVLNFDVNGIRAYVKIDCAVEFDGGFYLMDWKTSALRPKDADPLVVGALYANEVWGAAPGKISATAVSLKTGEVLKAKLDERALQEVRFRIETESRRLNEAASVFGTDPAGVPMTENIGTCMRCNFQRICHPNGVGEVF